MNLTFNVCLETLNFEPDKGGEEGEDLGQQEQGAQGAGEAGGHAGEGDRVMIRVNMMMIRVIMVMIRVFMMMMAVFDAGGR